jgi:hypothetical protein
MPPPADGLQCNIHIFLQSRQAFKAAHTLLLLAGKTPQMLAAAACLGKYKVTALKTQHASECTQTCHATGSKHMIHQ